MHVREGLVRTLGIGVFIAGEFPQLYGCLIGSKQQMVTGGRVHPGHVIDARACHFLILDKFQRLDSKELIKVTQFGNEFVLQQLSIAFKNDDSALLVTDSKETSLLIVSQTLNILLFNILGIFNRRSKTLRKMPRHIYCYQKDLSHLEPTLIITHV